MKTNKIGYLLIFFLIAFFTSCHKPVSDPLPSWNETHIKKQLTEYVNIAVAQIPEEDRIAVFDMDGTIACETPLWFEMAVAVQGMVNQADKNPSLDQLTEYQYARKLSRIPNDTTVLNHWVVDGVNYLDSIILKGFQGVDHEEYIQFANKYLTTVQAPQYGIYGDLFYQPMLELIQYLKENKFQIYIVSGSLQGVVWSICPQTIGFDRAHLIGTCQELTPVYLKEGTSFIIQKAIFKPKNDGNGKSQNIYDRIGKIPVMAVGNTTGDFGMFHLASTSKYPHLAMLINHDDPREYIYEPYHGTPVPGWQDSLRINNWIQADMSSEFKTIWKVKK